MKADSWRRLWLTAASANGAIGMIAAALQAHSLGGGQGGFVEVGSRYELIHALALFGVALLPGEGAWKHAAGWLFLAGTVLFSGSLYLMALIGAPALPTIPVGGTCFILGWIALGIAAWRHRPQEAAGKEEDREEG